jgi:hypothetical protein
MVAKTQALTFRLPLELVGKVRTKIHTEGLTFTDFVRQALRLRLDYENVLVRGKTVPRLGPVLAQSFEIHSQADLEAALKEIRRPRKTTGKLSVTLKPRPSVNEDPEAERAEIRKQTERIYGKPPLDEKKARRRR